MAVARHQGETMMQRQRRDPNIMIGDWRPILTEFDFNSRKSFGNMHITVENGVLRKKRIDTFEVNLFPRRAGSTIQQFSNDNNREIDRVSFFNTS